MKTSFILFGVFALLLASSVLAMEMESEAAPCHPQCRWQCDDPSCPAQCRQSHIRQRVERGWEFLISSFT